MHNRKFLHMFYIKIFLINLKISAIICYTGMVIILIIWFIEDKIKGIEQNYYYLWTLLFVIFSILIMIISAIYTVTSIYHFISFVRKNKLNPVTIEDYEALWRNGPENGPE